MPHGNRIGSAQFKLEDDKEVNGAYHTADFNQLCDMLLFFAIVRVS